MAPQKQDATVEYGDVNKIVKRVLKTIAERCKIEATRNTVMVPLNDHEARIAFYTGLPTSLIAQLLSDTPRISMLDLQSRILILETVKSIYTQTQLPSFSSIFEEASANGQLKTIDGKMLLGLNVFTEEMEILGYQLKETIQNQKIIMEDPEIRFERYMYLSKLKKFRSSMQWEIVYVDERIVNDKQQFQKPWIAPLSPKAAQVLEECVFYHAITKNGFLTGMFSNQASENDFGKWCTDILMMHLKSPSVIIMDNNAMHGSPQSVSSITRYHTKTDMLRWLASNSIPCSSNMSKPALYELIKKCNENNKEYHIDRIIRSQGHEILRLPRHLYDLSITTPLWNNTASSGGIGMTNTLMHLQNELMNLLTSIPSPKWVEYEQILEKQEKELFNIEMAMEKFSDKYELKLS